MFPWPGRIARRVDFSAVVAAAGSEDPAIGQGDPEALVAALGHGPRSASRAPVAGSIQLGRFRVAVGSAGDQDLAVGESSRRSDRPGRSSAIRSRSSVPVAGSYISRRRRRRCAAERCRTRPSLQLDGHASRCRRPCRRARRSTLQMAGPADGLVVGTAVDGLEPPPVRRNAPPSTSAPISGGRGEANGHGHGREPPRHAHGAPLMGVVDLVEGGIDHPVGQSSSRPSSKYDVEEAVEFELAGHRGRPPATAAARSSASMAARIARWA